MTVRSALLATGLVALMTLTATASETPTAAPAIDFGDVVLAPDATSFTLDNGMEVVVIPDHRAPIVTHMVWYRVGSADEPPGKSGIAHYLEHLMFKGTEANPGDAFSATVSRVGGQENAFTSNDYTAYFQQVSVENLAKMMAFEADRMRGLQLTEEVSAPERKVVEEERRARVETQPSALLGEALDAALFVNHPYGDPVIGWADEIAGLTHEDALSFYDVHYRPSNAILVVAGDVTADEVRGLAEATYGRIADDGDAKVRQRPRVQKLSTDRTLELRDPRVTQPNVQVAWIVPSYATAPEGEAEALDLLAEIVGGTNTSRLYTELVREQGLATAAGAYYQSTALDDTRFVFYAIPRDGVELPAIERAARAIIADVATNGVTEEELNRARTSLLASAIFAQDSQSSLARIFGSALTTGSTIEDVQAWPSRVAKVDAQDVRAVAQKYLTDTASVTARLLTPDV